MKREIVDFQYPGFLIVGAMKAGTTTLMRYLVRNPYIAIPNNEIHYFDKESNYRKGLDWYKKKFSASESTQIIGEKTPTYSYDPKVPARIYKDFPDCKIVWLFRNPVDRTYSNYIHAK
ncbi:MAG: sulfotransferase [Balneolaceae bacterium]|nr:sulfotransferase [Balneolaceae bacterium]